MLVRWVPPPAPRCAAALPLPRGAPTCTHTYTTQKKNYNQKNKTIAKNKNVFYTQRTQNASHNTRQETKQNQKTHSFTRGRAQLGSSIFNCRHGRRKRLPLVVNTAMKTRCPGYVTLYSATDLLTAVLRVWGSLFYGCRHTIHRGMLETRRWKGWTQQENESEHFWQRQHTEQKTHRFVISNVYSCGHKEATQQHTHREKIKNTNTATY